MGICCSRPSDNSVHAIRENQNQTAQHQDEEENSPNKEFERTSKVKSSQSREDKSAKARASKQTIEPTPTQGRNSKSGKSNENSHNATDSKGEILRPVSIIAAVDSSPPQPQQTNSQPPANFLAAPNSGSGNSGNSTSHGPKIQHAFTFSGPAVASASSQNPIKAQNHLAVMNVSNSTFAAGLISPTASMKSKKSRYLTEIPIGQNNVLKGLASPKNRRRRSEDLKNPPVGADGVTKIRRKAKRRTSHKGMMSRLALQFPQIRKSFMAVYSVFERYMMTKSLKKVNPRGKRGSTVEIKEMGAITQDKLGQVLEAITAVYGRKKFTEEEIKELFHIADLDGSKSISFREFLIAVALGYFLKHQFPEDSQFCEIQKGFKCVETAFKDMDDDNSNSVDANELKNALFSANSNHTNSTILEERFKELDINNDGDVSLPEFLFTLASWVGFWADDEDEPDAPMELAEQLAADEEIIMPPIAPASPKNRNATGFGRMKSSPKPATQFQGPEFESNQSDLPPSMKPSPKQAKSLSRPERGSPNAAPINRTNTEKLRQPDINVEEL